MSGPPVSPRIKVEASWASPFPVCLTLFAGTAYALVPDIPCRLPLRNCILLSWLAGWATFTMIPSASEPLKDAGLKGRDLLKRGQRVLPEAMGIVPGAVYMAILALFLPSAFVCEKKSEMILMFLAAMLSISAMLFLGFADNVLNFRWRVKLVFPALATLPLLTVYYAVIARTHVLLPDFFEIMGGTLLDLHFFFYILLALGAIFCVNAVNILAGINGLEVGQTLVLALTQLVNSLIALRLNSPSWPPYDAHLFSIYLLIPFCSVCSGLLYYNWYPASVFVGDTFCYFSGMTLAAAGILGQCSKTTILFFAPQVLNFLISLPQLLKWVPCPRHRMPVYLEEQDKLDVSYTCFFERGPGWRSLLISVLNQMGICRLIEEDTADKCSTTKRIKISNLTLINVALYWCGPVHERSLCVILLVCQGCWSAAAFGIRYGLAGYMYSHVE